ncbi:MAG: YrrC family ATP-dependent DNA helicase, partial [Bacillota bacterium]
MEVFILEQFEGTLEKIRYYSEESSYMVGLLRSREGKTVTIVGNFPPMREGEDLLVSGDWQI